MMWSAFGDLLTFDFVKAAIEGENLGSNPAGVPDILAISWTSHDYVNHLFGPESRQSQDQTIRLDRIFADLFDYLDKRIGLQNVLITLSADHGFMNIPEYSASRNLDAGRIDPDKMIEATNAALSAKFGDGKYITAWWNPNLYVDYKLIESRKLGPNWIRPGKYGDSEVVDLARTIAFILNVRPPNGCEGRVLSEALN